MLPDIADFIVKLGEKLPADKYEKRIEKIILSLKAAQKCFIAVFPFFNTNNSLIYDLIFYQSY